MVRVGQENDWVKGGKIRLDVNYSLCKCFNIDVGLNSTELNATLLIHIGKLQYIRVV